MGGGESRGLLQGRNRQAIDGSGQTARRKHETGNQRRYAPVYHKHTIGFVFQEYHLLTGYTVLENILLAAELTCQDNAKNREWALSLLRRLNIEEKANEKIENLSGGQKHRVAIARALAGKPQVILADEPTGALDRKTADEIMAILSEIAKQSPVLIITHDRKICDYADAVVTIEDGKCRVWKEAKKQAVTVLAQKEALPDVPISMSKRALHKSDANILVLYRPSANRCPSGSFSCLSGL